MHRILSASNLVKKCSMILKRAHWLPIPVPTGLLSLMLQQEVVPDVTVNDLVVNAMADHYKGDESIDPQLLPVLQQMAVSPDDLTRMLGGALLYLGTDPEPEDNNINLILSQYTAVKPFAVISDGKLDRTSGLKAVANICRTAVTDHEGSEVVVFQLMKGSTPFNIVALQKDINNSEELIAYFNETGDDFFVKVFVFDRLNSDLGSVQINLAEAQILN